MIGNRSSGVLLSPGLPHSPSVRGCQAAASRRSVTSPAVATARAEFASEGENMQSTSLVRMLRCPSPAKKW